MRRILRVCAFVIIDVLFAELGTCMPTPQFYSGSPVVELPGAAIAGRASPRASGGAGMVYVLVGLVSLPLLVTVLWLLRQLWRMLASCAGRGCPATARCASRPDHGLEEVVIIPADHQLHGSVPQGVPSASSALLRDGPLASSQQQHQFSPVSLMEEMLLASTREQMQSASTPQLHDCSLASSREQMMSSSAPLDQEAVLMSIHDQLQREYRELVTCNHQMLLYSTAPQVEYDKELFADYQSPSRHTEETEVGATCDEDQAVLSPPMQDLEVVSIPDAFAPADADCDNTQYTQELRKINFMNSTFSAVVKARLSGLRSLQRTWWVLASITPYWHHEITQRRNIQLTYAREMGEVFHAYPPEHRQESPFSPREEAFDIYSLEQLVVDTSFPRKEVCETNPPEQLHESLSSPREEAFENYPSKKLRDSPSSLREEVYETYPLEQLQASTSSSRERAVDTYRSEQLHDSPSSLREDVYETYPTELHEAPLSPWEETFGTYPTEQLQDSRSPLREEVYETYPFEQLQASTSSSREGAFDAYPPEPMQEIPFPLKEEVYETYPPEQLHESPSSLQEEAFEKYPSEHLHVSTLSAKKEVFETYSIEPLQSSTSFPREDLNETHSSEKLQVVSPHMRNKNTGTFTYYKLQLPPFPPQQLPLKEELYETFPPLKTLSAKEEVFETYSIEPLQSSTSFPREDLNETHSSEKLQVVSPHMRNKSSGPLTHYKLQLPPFPPQQVPLTEVVYETFPPLKADIVTTPSE
ncbi:adhesive plaque matrix protein-like [Bacillus rossius redtenbacheri]|uniref:adhesive plaque matrix protein-like n=1 Tax=Bacillus rossius redtenbacheri TaxID=93214 RepID=UPI002FDE5D58